MPGLPVVLLWLICILWAYFHWQQRKLMDEPPVYPGAWPVVGHIFSIMGRKKVYNFFRQMSLNLGHGEGVCTLLAGPVKLYVVSSPTDNLTIANQCLDKSVYYEFAKPWMGNSLILSERAEWKKDRKMLMPAFSSHVLGGFLETFNDGAKQVVEKISANVDKGSFDPSPYISEYATETLCKTVLGADIPNKHEYMHVLEGLMDIIVKRFVNLFLHSNTIYNRSNLKKTEKKYTKFVNDIADELIQKKRSEMKAKFEYNKGTKKNFLDLLHDISTKEAMSDEKMRDQLNVMIAGGFDTIFFALRVMLVMIGSHQNVQEKLYKEIIEVLGDKSGDLEKAELDRLFYLEAVIKESLRLHPPGQIVVREIKENIKLEKYTLYAGHSCMMLLSGVNLHSMWGDDVQIFKPERWLDPATLPDHRFLSATFSLGRRNCIGKYYAMMSMKTFLVHVVRNFIVTADCTKMEFAEDVILRIISGHHISLQHRS